jgi:hypothetical protein
VQQTINPGADSTIQSSVCTGPLDQLLPVWIDDPTIVFSEEGQPLCERCSSSVKIEDLLAGNWVYKGNFSDVAERATSCALCSLVWEVARHGGPPRPDDQHHNDFTHLIQWFNGEPPSTYKLTTRTFSDRVPAARVLYVQIRWPGETSRHTGASFKVYTAENGFWEGFQGTHPIGKVGPNTASVLSFDVAREWLEGCPDHAQQFRRLFCNSTEETKLGPSRVLDCFAGAPHYDMASQQHHPSYGSAVDSVPRDGCSTSCRLVDLADTDGKYAALSYCWGSLDYKTFVTTEKNVESRRYSIEELELPHVFQDAIRVARNLRIRYLWIDALCILQDWFKPPEDQVNWIRESARMANIFGGALITICAANLGREGGFFNENSCTAFDVSSGSTSARFRRSGGDTSTLHIVVGDHSGWQPRKSFTENRLRNRVWCYQEDLLSPRKLCYCRDQLYWHCDHVIASEDRLLDATRVRDYGSRLSSLDCHTQGFAERVGEYWYTYLISHGYSKRETTYERDRLVAVSGLAKRVAAAIQSRYLAGLWQSSVIQGLLWSATEPFQMKTIDAPSWSWASQQGGRFSYETLTDGTVWWKTVWSESSELSQQSWRTSWEISMKDACTFMRANIDYINPQDWFGGVIRGELTLRGSLLSITSTRDGHKLPLLPCVVFTTYWDDHRFKAADICAMALPLAIDAHQRRIYLLAVTTSASDYSRYVRVGSGVIDLWEMETEFLQLLDTLGTLPKTDITLV